ncbi:c-Maf-inducing protein [Trichonephila clavipes]|nr:c-Maf-inducing protein [Trichonephila clavipes]
MRNMLKYRKLLCNTRRADVFLKELKSLVEMTLTTPLQDDCIYNSPLELISEILQEGLAPYSLLLSRSEGSFLEWLRSSALLPETLVSNIHFIENHCA